MAIQGLRTTANFVTDQRPKNWREGILLLYPNGSTPLTAITSLMKKREVDDAEFNWWDKNLSSRRLQLVSSATALTLAGTTVTLEASQNGKMLKVGDILLVEQTGEQLRVTADPASETSITVSRGWAASTAATLDTTAAGKNPFLKIMGSSYEEGSLAPTGVSYDPTKRYNFTQIFRNTLEMTNTAMKTKLRTGDAIKEAKRECLEYHSIDMEWSFWKGTRYEGTLNGKPVRELGGLEYWISQYSSSANIKTVTSDYPSGLTMRGFEEYCYSIFQVGAKEKMCFGGNRSLLTINRLIRKNSQQHFVMGDTMKEYGMDVTRIVTPFGTLVFKNHPLFNQVPGGTTGGTAYYGMESWLYILDMANITYVYMKDRDTHYEPDLESNGMDGVQSGYLTECSIEVHHPQSHFLLKNLVDAVADAS